MRKPPRSSNAKLIDSAAANADNLRCRITEAMICPMGLNAFRVAPGTRAPFKKFSVHPDFSACLKEIGDTFARHAFNQSSTWGTAARKRSRSSCVASTIGSDASGAKKALTATRCCAVSLCCRAPRIAI